MIDAKAKEENFEIGLLLSDRRRMIKQINKAKEHITDLIGAKKDQNLLFYPSKEEALLRVIYQVLMPKAQRTGKNIILIPKTESGAIVNLLKSAGLLGLSFKEIEVDKRGKITPEALTLALNPRVLGLFLSWAEPFTGAIAPVFELSCLCQEKEIFLLVDATDSAGKVFFRFQDMKIDVLLFTHKQITLASTNKLDMQEGNYFLKDFFNLADYARETIETMDLFPVEYAVIKTDVIDRIEKSTPDCIFLNKGSGYLFDRWCFSFKGIFSENLAYFLREKEIFVKQTQDGALSLSFTLEESKEKIFIIWDQIISTAKMIKEFSYE